MLGDPLSVSHPELAAQSVGWDPSAVATNSNRILPWRCDLGHEWDARVFSRARSGNGCPFCANRKVLAGFNDLATTHPALAAEAVGWDPAAVIAGSARTRQWRCGEGHRFSATPASRVGGTRCAVCANRQVLVGFNDLATTRSELAEQADGWDPTKVTAGSKSRRRWRCGAGHTWEAQVSERARRNSSCPQCANRPVRRARGNLADDYPELAAQAVDWDPTSFTSGSSGVQRWRCEEGHEWDARINHRVRGTRCPVCTNRVVVPGTNDLATTRPDLATQAVDWDTTAVASGTPQRRLWRCGEGHEWMARVDVRAAGSGCPVCSNHQLLPGVNDLGTTNPELAAQAVGWDPSTCMAGSNEKRRWRCEEGHEWDAIVNSRTAGNNCAVCSGRTLLTGFNDLATIRPDLVAEADGWDPSTVVSGSKKKLLWRCAEGHQWAATVASRTRHQASGCPTCGNYGFSADLPGYLYLIAHEEWGLLKVGVSNVPDRRIGLHVTRGWRLVDQIGPFPGSKVYALEREILKGLQTKPVSPPPKHLGRFDGYTEAWRAGSLPVSSVAELLDAVVHGRRPC